MQMSVAWGRDVVKKNIYSTVTGSNGIAALEEGAQPRAQTVLGAVGRIDADVLRGEVAGPVACAGGAGVQVHHDGHVVG